MAADFNEYDVTGAIVVWCIILGASVVGAVAWLVRRLLDAFNDYMDVNH